MRIPPFERYPGLFTALGFILSGMIIGCALFVGVYNQNFNILFNKYIDQLAENKNLNLQIEDLKKYKNKQTIISQINVHAESSSEEEVFDKSTEIEIENRVYKDLQIFKGKAVEDIASHPEFVWKSIDQKIYASINEKDYIVKVKTMAIIQSNLSVWIQVKPFERN